MTKPMFITFTGVDEYTPLLDMQALSLIYPIEWGVLFSPTQQGKGRYPPLYKIGGLVEQQKQGARFRLAAHLCGGHSRDLLETNRTMFDPLLRAHFARVQVNVSDATPIGRLAVSKWAHELGVLPIMQCRGAFPVSQEVLWLFDASGGRGIEPRSWPAPANQLHGYAGGLNPENVAKHVALISEAGTESYWIDMESGVRDANDRFSLDKCRAVCQAVYGDGQ